MIEHTLTLLMHSLYTHTHTGQSSHFLICTQDVSLIRRSHLVREFDAELQEERKRKRKKNSRSRKCKSVKKGLLCKSTASVFQEPCFTQVVHRLAKNTCLLLRCIISTDGIESTSCLLN